MKNVSTLLILTSLTLIHLSAEAIYGGRTTAPGEFESVAFLNFPNEATCSGNLIKNDEVLSALHCLTDGIFFSSNIQIDLEKTSDLLELFKSEILFLTSKEELNDVSFKNFNSHEKELIRNSTEEVLRAFLMNQVREGFRIKFGNNLSVVSFEPPLLSLDHNDIEEILVPSGFFDLATQVIFDEEIKALYLETKLSKDFFNFDQVKYKLKKPVLSISPIPALPTSGIVHGFTLESLEIVGFGLGVQQHIFDEFSETVQLEFSRQLGEEAFFSGTKRTLSSTVLLKNFREHLYGHYITPDNSAGAYAGDSGGPLFVKSTEGALYQFGILVAAGQGFIYYSRYQLGD